MENALKTSNKIYNAFDTDIKFYASKSYSKRPLNDEFDIETSLIDYNIDVSLYKKQYHNEKGLIQANFAPHIKFNGVLLEFDFNHLTENESTVILSGILDVLGNKKQKSFLGNIKKNENVIHISSNFILDIQEYNFEKVFNCNTLNASKNIRIELSLELT